jgi:hypothetical protein
VEAWEVEVSYTPEKTVKVLIGIPNEGHTLVDAYDNRLLMFQYLGALEVFSKLGIHEFEDKTYDYPEGTAFEFALATVGNVLTPIARERIAEIAMEYDYDYLFFIDDDMICPKELFLNLYRHQKDIVGALAFTRFAPHKPVIYIMDEGFDPVAKKNYYSSRCWLDYPKDQLVECDAVGFGSVLINCRTFKDIPRPWFTAATGKGEDIQFCYEAKRAGFKVYMDTATKLGHLGPPRNITEELFESQPDIMAMREENSQRLNGEQHD